MAKTLRPLAVRAFAEGFAIFAGVLLALVADDWRETRSERREAGESLAVVMADLESDSAEYVKVETTARRWTAMAAWLLDDWDGAGRDRDSLEVALYTFSDGESLQLSRAGFDGLESANRLRLLRNDSLRTALLEYYQVAQRERQFRYETVVENNSRLSAALVPHVIHPAGAEPGSVWPPRERSLRLRRPWSAVAADPELHYAVVRLGRSVDYLADLMDTGDSLSSALRSAIARELAGR